MLMAITYQDIQHNEMICAYIRKADETLAALGYTEHGFAHVTRTAVTARRILSETGHDAAVAELAAIAGYMHDIGNSVNRSGHERSGALMAFSLLRELGADAQEIATVIAAIGHHDEGTAYPVNDVAAALIIADKSDVRFSRVRNKETIQFDIHDRVNFAVKKSDVIVDAQQQTIALDLTIDTQVSSISDYFEIFLSRMLLCRRAAEQLGYKFALVMNGQAMM